MGNRAGRELSIAPHVCAEEKAARLLVVASA